MSNFYNIEQYRCNFDMVRTRMTFAFIIFLFDFSLSSNFFNNFFSLLTIRLSLPTGVLSSSDQIPSSFLNLGVSMFDPTREHDTNPTRVFSG